MDPATPKSPPPRKPRAKGKRKPYARRDGRAIGTAADGRKTWKRKPGESAGVGNKIGRPKMYRKEMDDQLLAHMANGESFPSFAAVAGVCIQTIYEWSDPSSPYYEPSFSEARRKGEALLLRVDEALGRTGITGKLKFVSTKVTKPDGTVIEKHAAARFAGAPWIFVMKNRYPTLYRDRQEHALAPTPGDPGKPDRPHKEKVAELKALVRALALTEDDESEEGAT
jgi:hypothetical protein